MTRTRPAVLAALVALTGGCADAPARKPVFPVTGRVTAAGAPLGGAVVSFHPAGEVGNPRAQRSFTTAEKDGTFRLTTYETHDGAPAGEYVVTVYWPGPVPPNSPIGEVGPDRLKGRYADQTTTKLRAAVREQPNTIDFDLQ